MPRAKNTTEAEAVKPTAKPKTTKKAKTTSSARSKISAPKVVKTAAPKVVPAASKIANLEKRLNETENKLNSLISIIHNDLQRGQLKGPEGLASKLRRAGLLA